MAAFVLPNRVVTLCLVLALPFQTLSQTNPISIVSSGNNDFAFDLHTKLRELSPEKNLIVSPFSISAAMAMVQAGARGESADAIRKTLKFPSNNEDLHSAFQTFLQELKSDSSVTLQIANKLYSSEDYPLKSEFVNTLKTYYGAEPQLLNFRHGKEAAATINNFVANVTQDKIKDLIKENDLDALTKLVLVNGVYFKGTWQYPFPTNQTYKKTFYAIGNKSVEVDMMKLETEKYDKEINVRVGRSRDLGASIAVLPYNGDKNLSMIVLVPISISEDLSILEDKLRKTSWEKVFENIGQSKAIVELPKFKLEYSLDLTEPLKQLGAEVIFDSRRADFSGIPEVERTGLYVSKIAQKAFIEVNEEGSEAAAATAVNFKSRTGPISVIADRPFLAIIAQVKNSNSKVEVMPLFMSRIMDPTVSK